MEINDRIHAYKIAVAARDFLSDEANQVGGPVNWARVRVSEVRKFQAVTPGDDTDTEGWQVIIENASPDAHELRDGVQKHLASMGLDAEVVTEW